MTDRSVPITLDKLRHLRYSFNDLADLQAANPSIFEADMGAFSTIRTFLWAGLKWEDPELQPYPRGERLVGDIVEEWIAAGNGTHTDIGNKITEAMKISVTVTAIEKRLDEKKKAAQGAGATPSKNSLATGSLPVSG